MAWGVKQVEEIRKQFIDEYFKGNLKLSVLCRQYEISRPTAYKWIERYKKDDLTSLSNVSTAPNTQANATKEDLVMQILLLRIQYPQWGANKIRGWFVENYPSTMWPSTTTMDNLFKKNGLVVPRKLRKRIPIKTAPLSSSEELNHTWCIDFKGWWLTRDNIKCDPITLTDSYSRYLIRCTKLFNNTSGMVWGMLQAAFYEYGLPLFLRHDNGPPFATTGAGRLSPLSIKLIKAGVTPEWIEPGQPQQNGRHERMHLTLKKEGVFPNLTLEEQLIKICEFQEYYNFERPHEALNQKTPGSLYLPSNRIWAGKLRSPEYENEYQIGWVKSCGKMSWKGKEIYIGRTLSNEEIGLKVNDKGNLTAYFGPIFLGEIIDNEINIERNKDRKRKRKK